MSRPVIKGGYGQPSQYVPNTDVNGTFTATGSSNSVQSKGVDVSVSGTFVATVLIERFLGGAWRTVETLTSPAERFIENDKSRPTRVRCSGYTSGTVTYVLEA